MARTPRATRTAAPAAPVNPPAQAPTQPATTATNQTATGLSWFSIMMCVLVALISGLVGYGLANSEAASKNEKIASLTAEVSALKAQLANKATGGIPQAQQNGAAQMPLNLMPATGALEIANNGVCNPAFHRYQWNGRNDWCVGNARQTPAHLVFNKTAGMLGWWYPPGAQPVSR
jgi:uncharacterized protein HemX